MHDRTGYPAPVAWIGSVDEQQEREMSRLPKEHAR
jgi:hypothetical protein